VWLLISLFGGEELVTLHVDEQGKVCYPRREFDAVLVAAAVSGIAVIILVIFILANH
jgi:hypothetical protein